MKTITKIVAMAAAAVTALTMSACSTINTTSDMVALHYNGGFMTAESFIECVPASSYKNNPPGHVSYDYPTSLRYFVADTEKLAEKAESGSIIVVSKDNTEMLVPVSVGFKLVTDCETLRKFHDDIAKRDKSFWGGSEFADENKDSIPDGWVKILKLYIGDTLDAALDRISQKYNWRALWNDPEIKVEVEKSVEASLSREIDTRMGGHFFEIKDILIKNPQPAAQSLKDAIVAEQAAVAKANAARAEADAQEKAADAQKKAADAIREVEVAKAKTEAAVIEAQIRVIGTETWIKKYGIDKGITPWPNPVVPGGGNVAK